MVGACICAPHGGSAQVPSSAVAVAGRAQQAAPALVVAGPAADASCGHMWRADNGTALLQLVQQPVAVAGLRRSWT